jgi:hypothetical protein
VKGEDQRQGIIYPNITINDNLSLHLSFSERKIQPFIVL